MHSIHPAKVGLWIRIQDAQAGRPPCSPEVNPEATVVRKRIADPLGAGTILNDDDNSAAVVEIPHGDAASPTRPPADCFNDECVPSGVWRPRDAGENGEGSDRVRDTDEPLRKSHLNDLHVAQPPQFTCGGPSECKRKIRLTQLNYLAQQGILSGPFFEKLLFSVDTIFNSSSRARSHATLPTLTRRNRLPGAALVHISASSRV
jgi:hypothetical protein